MECETLKKELETLNRGSHSACIYKVKKEQFSSVVPFILYGLKTNEKCIYIADENTKKEIIQMFKDVIPIEEYIDSHQLELFTREEAYLKDGCFDPDSMITLLRQYEEHALKNGYKGLRITGEMTWILTKLPGTERIIEYEAKLNHFFPTSTCTALCQYNEKKIDPDILFDVVCTHPNLIIYGTLYENSHYLPPDEFFARMKGEVHWNTYKMLVTKIINEAKAREEIEKHKWEKNLILDSLSELVVYFGKDKKVKWVNKAGAQSTCMQPDDIIGKHCRELWHCEGVCRCPLHRTWETREHEQGEVVLPGDRLWYVKTAPVCERGELIGAVMIAHDITERKKAEEALKKSEEKYRQLIERLCEGIWVIDENAYTTFVNSPMAEMLGYTAEEMIGKHLFEFMDDRGVKICKHYLERRRQGIVEQHEFEFCKKDGTRIYTTLETSPVYDDNGNYTGAIAGVMDITDRKKAEELLRESEELYRKLMQTSPDAVAVTDLEGHLTHVSEKMLALHRVDHADELLGKSVFTLVAPKDHEKAMKTLEKTLKEGVVENVEYTMVKKDGSTFIGELNAAVIKDAEGNPKAVIATVRDITEKKRAEEQIKTSAKEKEILLREIHHRVKNNLQIISSLLNLQAEHIKDSQYTEMLKDSRHRIRSMALIHEKLYQSENLARIDFSEYITSLVTGLAWSYRGGGGNVAVKTEVEDIAVGIDTAIPCGLIINELVSNALKHAFPDDKKGEILVRVCSVNGTIELTVKDNGVGIPDIDFRKTESLGLDLVTTLAEQQLGGEITLDRTEGTAFTITFKEV